MPLMDNRGRAVRLAAGMICLWALTGVGCRSTGFQATALPPAARSMSAMPPIDLSSLSQGSSLSDQIYPGDTLNVTIATGVEATPPTPWRVRVAPDGAANVPELGPVRLAGMKLTDAEQVIRQESIQRQLYRHPHVTVTMNQRRTHRVTVLGAVNKPSSFDIPAPSCDLATVLMHAEGLADDHSGIVVIKQPGSPGPPGAGGPSLGAGGPSPGARLVSHRSEQGPWPPTVSRLDLRQLNEQNASGLLLADGATVEVLKQEPRTVQVLGLVNKPGHYEVDADEEARLLHAIALAGGQTLQVADKVRIIRTLPSQEKPLVIHASIDEAKKGGAGNVLLASGDVVVVEETPLTFTVGMLQSFIRVGFSASIPGL